MAELMLPNFLGAYNQGVQMRRQNELLLAQQRQAQIEAAQKMAIQNELASSADPYGSDVMNRLARLPGGLSVAEQLAKVQEARGKGMQETTKGLEGRMAYWKKQIPADPRFAPTWVRSAYNDPVVGPELSKLGSADEVIAGIPQDPTQYMKWVEGASMFADEVSKRRVPSAEAMLPYTQPLSPEVFQQKMQLEGAKRPVSTTNITTKLEGAESTEKGKLNVEVYKGIQSTANAARALAPKLTAIRATLDKGFETGQFAPIKTEAAAFLSAIGVKDSIDPATGKKVGPLQYATDAQKFKAIAQERVLERQLEQKGVQTTSDAARMEQTFARLGNTTEANRFLVDVADAQGKMAIKQQKFWDDWWNKNRTYEGVEQAWNEGEGSKSIFDMPNMKRYLESSNDKNQIPAPNAAAGGRFEITVVKPPRS